MEILYITVVKARRTGVSNGHRLHQQNNKDTQQTKNTRSKATTIALYRYLSFHLVLLETF
jgi:hypothetical protein